MVRAGAGERGGFGGASSRTVGSGHQAYRQTSKNSTSYSRNPPFLVWKSAPELGPEHSGTAVNRRLRARSIFLTVDASHAQCSGYMQPLPPVPRTFLRAVCAHAGRDAHRVCKRGVGPCARCRGGGVPGLSNCRRATRSGVPVLPAHGQPEPRSPPWSSRRELEGDLRRTIHRDKTNFCGRESPRGFSHSACAGVSGRGSYGDFERPFHTKPHTGGPKGSLGRIKTAQGHTQNLR